MVGALLAAEAGGAQGLPAVHTLCRACGGPERIAPAAAIDVAGRAVVAWTDRGRVYAALRSRGRIGPARLLGGNGRAEAVTTAITPGGAVAVAWWQTRGPRSGMLVRVKARGPGARFGRTALVPGSRLPVLLRSGPAFLLVSNDDPAGEGFRVSVRSVGEDGVLSGPTTISGAPAPWQTQEPRAAAVGTGMGAVAAWREQLIGAGTTRLRAASRGADGTWEPPREIPTGSGSPTTSPRVAAGRGGDAVAVWRTFTGQVAASARAADDSWTPGNAIGRSIGAVGPAALVDAGGRALAAFTGGTIGRLQPVVARRDGDGTWSGPSPLSRPPRGPLSLGLALIGDRVGRVVWHSGRSRQGRILGASVRTIRGAFSPPRTLAAAPLRSSTEAATAVVANRSGLSLVAFTRSDPEGGARLQVLVTR